MVGTRSASTYLVTDLPIHDAYADTECLVSEVRTLFGALQEALAQSPGKCSPIDGAWPREPLTIDQAAGAEFRALCEFAGWEFYERGNGQLAITLDVPGQFCQAFAYQMEAGETRVSTVLEMPALAGKSLHAVALFLLTASRVVRMGRATLQTTGVAREYRWEVAWPSMPSRHQFHSGLWPCPSPAG